MPRPINQIHVSTLEGEVTVRRGTGDETLSTETHKCTPNSMALYLEKLASEIRRSAIPVRIPPSVA